MFFRLSIAAPLVLPPPQPWGYSPPGSVVALLCCCGLSRLAALLDGRCSTVAGGVCRCSARELLDFFCPFTLVSIAGTGSLGLLHCPPLCTEPPDASSHLDGGCWSLWCRRQMKEKKKKKKQVTACHKNLNDRPTHKLTYRPQCRYSTLDKSLA